MIALIGLSIGGKCHNSTEIDYILRTYSSFPAGFDNCPSGWRSTDPILNLEMVLVK